MACSNILINTHKGYVRQIDGLAMGQSPAPQLANIWMASFDKRIKGTSSLYKRYMDDVLRIINKSDIQTTLKEVNSYHDNLKFTIEEESEEGTISFLDMKLRHKKLAV